MDTIKIEADSSKALSIPPGKVGFLWGVTSDNGLKCVVVDGHAVKEGVYEPPYVVRRSCGFLSRNVPTKASYFMEVLDDKDKGKPAEEKKEPAEVTERVPRIPHIINHILNNSGQWYEIHLPADAVTWQMKARGNHTMYYSFSPDHKEYVTLQTSQVLSEDTMPNKGIRSIFVMSDDSAVTVELEVWRECQR
jgi:hypothetical protein